MIRAAGTAEIIRSHQKDDYYRGYLRSLFADVFRSIAGARRWIRWRRELDVAGDLVYFLMTTIPGMQTVGEEYVNIIQTDPSMRKIPSALRRWLMVLLQVGAPYLLSHALASLEHLLRSTRNLDLDPATADFLLRAIPVVRQASTLLHRCHLSLFYLQGIFYHLAKRLAGVHYVQYVQRAGVRDAAWPFRLLGWLSLGQLGLGLLLQALSLWKQWRLRQQSGSPSSARTLTEEAEFVPPGRKCSLCLEGRKHSTCTPCGHLFCWACIHEWGRSKPECPLCREKFKPQQLVALQCYDIS